MSNDIVWKGHADTGIQEEVILKSIHIVRSGNQSIVYMDSKDWERLLEWITKHGGKIETLYPISNKDDPE